MDLVAIGINFKSAPLTVREALSYSADRVPAVLRKFRRSLPETELLLLSTCNRTEFYAAVLDRKLDVDLIGRIFLAAGAGLAPETEEHVYVLRCDDAVEHLMAVATGLDSLVVGETEILGQVKQAYQLALKTKTTGRILNALLQEVFRVAKRVRSETGISRGRVSVGSIAVDLAGKMFADLSKKTVMNIGAGEIGEQTIKTLVEKGIRDSYVVNRSIKRGRIIADRYGSIALPFDRLADFLPRADIVISSTSAPHCILGVETVSAAMRARHGKPMLLVDLAVPRDVEAAAANIPNIYYYDIDDLMGVANENLAKRRDAMEHARRIVRKEAAAVAAELRADSLGIGSFMKKLDRIIAEIAEAELARAFAKEKVSPLGNRCAACRDEMRNMLCRALAKMAAGPKKALNEAAKNGTWDEFSKTAALMYGLDTDSAEQPSETRNGR